MKLILYSRGCVTCRFKRTVEDLRKFVQQYNDSLDEKNRVEVVVKRVDYHQEIKDEAQSLSRLPFPFVYSENGKSVRLTDRSHWPELL